MNPVCTRLIRPVLALVVVAGLSACGSVKSIEPTDKFEATSRAAPVATDLTASSDSMPINTLGDINVTRVNVQVPQSLRVSEANRFYPGGDIVWREDPIGDRHQQVQVIVQTAIEQGSATFNGSKNVELEIVVHRFHALTEKARYTVGGVHAIQFDLAIRDGDTGALLMEPKLVKADFDALGGRAAIQAESKGITQKVRITNHLAHVIRQELTAPGSYVAPNTGILGAINQL